MIFCKKIVVYVGLFLLTACAELSIKHKKELNSLENLNLNQWSFRGRLSIKGDDMINATIYWRHDDTKDRVKLAGIFGLGAIKIKLSNQCISLERTFGEIQYSCNVDDFIAGAIGFKVPIYALREWVIGQPIVGVDAVKIPDGFEQYGWQVHYKKYQKSIYGRMPRILSVKKGEIKLNLVIDKWGV